MGRGKSYLLEAIGRQLLDDGVRVRYEFTPDLLKALRNSFSRDSLVDTSEIDARCSGAEVLLLDDVGAESTTPWTNERVTTFVDERYRSGRRLAVATKPHLWRDDGAQLPAGVAAVRHQDGQREAGLHDGRGLQDGEAMRPVFDNGVTYNLIRYQHSQKRRNGT